MRKYFLRAGVGRDVASFRATWLEASVGVYLCKGCKTQGRLAQLARALPLQGRCQGFESLSAHRLMSCVIVHIGSKAVGRAPGFRFAGSPFGSPLGANFELLALI